MLNFFYSEGNKKKIHLNQINVVDVRKETTITGDNHTNTIVKFSRCLLLDAVCLG